MGGLGLRKFLFYFITFILLLIFIPIVHWYNQPVRQAELTLMDKTVPNDTYREHKGLVWLLNHLKWGKKVRSVRDYVGYYPGESREEGEVKPLLYERDRLLQSEVLYVADTYGVYTNDLTDNAPSGERSNLIYGGLNDTDMELIQFYLTQPNKMLIAEFNTMASPTSEGVRRQMEELLHLEWSGWMGRHFMDLSNEEIPEWMPRNYEKQYGEPWNFIGPGFVLVREDDYILVLPDEPYMGDDLIRVVQTKNEDGYPFRGASKNIAYEYWFDIVIPREGSVVKAWYEWDTNDKAKAILQKHRIPLRFPAVVHYPGKDYQAYYFAGDYVDVNEQLPPHFVSGMLPWKYFWSIGLPQTEFFWQFYVPMMKQILDEQTKGDTEGG